MSIFDGLLKSRDQLKKEMTDAEWWDMDIRRIDIAITELLFEMQYDIDFMQEQGYPIPDVPSISLLKSEEAQDVIEKKIEKDTALPGRGKRYPEVAFVGASPSQLDIIRDRPFAGMVGKTLKELYIDPLGLEMDDVYLTTLVKEVCEQDGKTVDPTTEQIHEAWEEFAKEMDSVQPRYLVALGKTAAKFLGDNATEWVPHPRAIRIMGDSGEVTRKMERLKKAIETPNETMTGTIIKSEDEKQIVYGVVMEPLENDTDTNWTDSEQIENAAHYFMKNFQLIDTNHNRQDIDAVPVESWLQHEDTVINGKDVKAGSWVMGVKVEDSEEWGRVKEGDFTGFSIDAFARIAPHLELP